MPTPTLAQARSQYYRQRRISLAALAAIRRLFARNPRPTVPEITATTSGYQLAAATLSTATVASYADAPSPLTIPRAFMGISSLGFPLTEPIIATIDRHIPAPVEPLPAPWWDDASTFMRDLEQLLLSEIADAGRTASQVEFVTRPDWQNYVRMLTPPSCDRCAILAGRIYRDLDAFDRHPGCDCVMVPVQDWQSAHDEGLASTFQQVFERGDVRGLSQADAQAIRDGADPVQVVNARRGTSAPGITSAYTTTLHGRKVKATRAGTTKRSAWRKANPTRLVRLRPEAIYRIVDEEYGGDPAQARRLLALYGYLR